MDAYPANYVEVNIPLIVLSGFGEETVIDIHPIQQNGIRIFSDYPPVVDSGAHLLSDKFKEVSLQDNKSPNQQYRVNDCNREYWLPCRKSNPQASFVGTPPSNQPGNVSPSSSLHSPLSPLTPGSFLNPDGLLTLLWLAKHQDIVPAAFIAAFKLSNDPAKDSLNDNLLKAEISNVKNRVEKSNYRIQFVVILLGESSLVEAPEVEERIVNIRKATKLDTKTSFYCSVEVNEEGARNFVMNVLSSIRPACIAHYSELTKHSRRKRDRGSFPSVSPIEDGGRPLASQGWRLRYEFKLGAFAEFRDEFSVAQRHFSSTLEMLLDNGGMLESISSWSPRWNEARQLADITAIRLLRSYLSSGMPSHAAKAWRKHRERIRHVVDDHGKGTSNYGWYAWEANWCKVMSQLLEDCPIAVEMRENKRTFATSEKMPSGVYQDHPWENLHHSGYWLKLASKISQMRKDAAYDMPEEDRSPPDQSPATRVARKTELYDTYLAPEPHEEYPISSLGGYDHSSDIRNLLKASASKFADHDQSRMHIFANFSRTRHVMDSFEFLKALWQKNLWRNSNWNILLRAVTQSLHDLAVSRGDIRTQLATLWELMNNDFVTSESVLYDFTKVMKSLASGESIDTPISIELRGNDIKSLVHFYFTFDHTEGHVGEPIDAQIILFSKAHPETAPITLSNFDVDFDAGPSIIISHNEQNRPSVNRTENKEATHEVLEIVSSKDSRTLQGSTDLTLKPGQFKIFSLSMTVRETGTICAVAAKLTIETSKISFAVSYDLTADQTMSPSWQRIRTLSPKQRSTLHAAQIDVLPKPPKVDVNITNMRNLYYTNEVSMFNIICVNNESEEVSAILDFHVLGEQQNSIQMAWASEEEHHPNLQQVVSLQSTIGKLATGQSLTKSILLLLPSLPSDLGLDVRVSYRLASDPDSPISKASIADISVARPFEANFDIKPCVHEDRWPSFFDIEESPTEETKQENTAASHGTQSAQGIVTRWDLLSAVTSFAAASLNIRSTTLRVVRVHGDATINVTDISPSNNNTKLEPQERRESVFRLDITKLELEERRITAIDAELEIAWVHDSSASQSFVSTLPVPRLSFPTGEPRVLASTQTLPDGLVNLAFTLENPSMHFLTFNLTMEMSEEFAFSGSKFVEVNLVPLSRHTVNYVLLPFVRGAHIQPQLKVVDAYFNKSLQIQAANGVVAGEDGSISIWVEEDQAAET